MRMGPKVGHPPSAGDIDLARALPNNKPFFFCNPFFNSFGRPLQPDPMSACGHIRTRRCIIITWRGEKEMQTRKRESGRRASASNKNYFYFFTFFFFFFLLLLPPINKHIFRWGAPFGLSSPLSWVVWTCARRGEKSVWMSQSRTARVLPRREPSSSRSLWSMRKRKKGSRQII